MGATKAYRSEFVGTQEWLVARARREWFSMIFLMVWLTGWTIGGLFAIFALFSDMAGQEGGIFLGVWLCGWTVGWLFAASRISWYLGGRFRLTVAGGTILYERAMPGFRRMEEYEIARITRLYPVDGGIEFQYDSRNVTLFDMLDGAQAREVAQWLTQRAPAGSFAS